MSNHGVTNFGKEFIVINIGVNSLQLHEELMSRQFVCLQNYLLYGKRAIESQNSNSIHKAGLTCFLALSYTGIAYESIYIVHDKILTDMNNIRAACMIL